MRLLSGKESQLPNNPPSAMAGKFVMIALGAFPKVIVVDPVGASGVTRAYTQ